MAVSKENILETISNMTVLEVVELVKAMEDKFGVSAAVAAAPVAAAGGAAAAATAAEEQTEFNVVMTKFGENKVGVIKGVLKRPKILLRGCLQPSRKVLAKPKLRISRSNWKKQAQLSKSNRQIDICILVQDKREAGGITIGLFARESRIYMQGYKTC
ncbi:MAG: ribosomal protein [Gammaproteobacteria bacterium]|nr:ribosomal protein [Gammaproteobacteria bacterium]